jgi:RNase H-like protein
MRNKLNQLLRLQTRDGQTLIEFSLLFSLIALVGLTILVALHEHLGGLPQMIAPVQWPEGPMLSPRLRERLSRLARGIAEPDQPVPNVSSSTAGAADAPQASPASPQPQPWHLTYELPGSAVTLEGPEGACLLVQPDLRPLLPDHAARVDAWAALPPDRWGLPERRLFLDIETAGLAGQPLFLVGTLALEGETLRLRQLLARDYPEEPALLAQFFARASLYESLVTFNGQTFDLPYLLDRALFHRCPAGFPQAHTDLLGLSRRRWRGLVPDCRLTTLERCICGRGRVADLAGADVPEVYHAFVRSGSWDLLGPVLFHNALDLLAMTELASRL